MKQELDQSLFRHLLESAPDAIVIADSSGRIIISNSQAEKLFGYLKDELDGQPVEVLIPTRYRDGHVKHRESYAGRPSVRPMGAGLELYARKKDGSEFPAEISISPLRNDNGMYVTSVIRDVTDRKKVEERIRASLREKEVLLKEVHHRVKNNLQIISSIINLQSESVKDDSVKQLFSETRARVRSIALVHERLYESKNLESIDFKNYVGSLIDDICEVYNVTCHDRIKIKSEIDSINLGIDTVVNLGLIIHELISNGVKYAFPSGKAGTLEVALKQNGNGMTLIVRDDGVGLPAGFSRDNVTTLGLTLVEGLTKEIGGTLYIESAHGATFRIDLPSV